RRIMKPIQWQLIGLAAAVFLVLLLGTLIMTAPKHPVALIRVVDASGKPLAGAKIKPEPLKDAHVVTWPNARYGEWSAVILMGDCYNTSEFLRGKPGEKFSWGRPVLDFQGVSDSAGLAVIPNLPADVKQLAVEHPQFVLPAVGPAGSGKHLQASITLIAGQTNRMSVQLEP